VSAFKYQQTVVDGVEVSEVWGLDNVTDDKKEAVIKEWIDRHAHRAMAQGFTHAELTPDPEDSGHFVFKARP
jgi:hypothetical protein